MRSFAFCLAVALASPAAADLNPTPVQQAHASTILFETGVARGDVFLMVAAAKLRKGLDLRPAERMAEGGEASDDTLTWQAMLAAARDAAGGDDYLLGMIEDVEAETTKGVTGGPVYNTARIGAKGDDIYRAVPFDGRKYAEIYVEGKGPQDLNVYVFDDQNRLVCSDTDGAAVAYCGWTPRAGGAFSIKVENKDGAPTTYSLITN